MDGIFRMRFLSAFRLSVALLNRICWSGMLLESMNMLVPKLGGLINVPWTLMMLGRLVFPLVLLISFD